MSFPILGRRVVPPFEWRGLIAMAFVFTVAGQVAWWEFQTRLLSPISLGAVGQWIWHAARFVPPLAFLYWGLRRWQSLPPVLAASAVALLTSELTGLALTSLSRFACWGATFELADLVDVATNLLLRSLYIIPAAILIWVLVRYLLIRIDEPRPDQCPACGYSIGDDPKITKCPECGRPRGEPIRLEVPTRIWIALQRRSRPLAIVVAMTLGVWVAHRIFTRTLPTREFVHQFDTQGRWPRDVFLGTPSKAPQPSRAVAATTYFAAISRAGPGEPPLVYLFSPDPAAEHPHLRVLVGVLDRSGCDAGTEPVHVDLDAAQARATIRQGGVSRRLAAELGRRAELVHWRPAGQTRLLLPDGPSIDPRPYFTPGAAQED